MRILLASTSSGSRGGGELFLEYLGRALHQLGHSVGLWVSDHERMTPLADRFSTFGEVIRAPYVNTYDLKGRSLSSYWHVKNRRTAIDSWREWNPEVIHINKQNLEDGLDLLSAANQCGIPNICLIHITQSARYLKAINARLRDWVSRRALRHYGSIIATVGDSRRQDLVSFTGWPADRVRCIYNGIPDPRPDIDARWRDQYRNRLDLGDDDVLVTMTARLTAQKDPGLFLSLAETAHSSNAKLKFLWIGPGELADYWDNHVSAHGMSDYVQRIGWQEDVRPWLTATDVYLHTASYEGLPFSILEALSMGLPCILTQSMLDQIGPFSTRDLGVIGTGAALADELSDRMHLETMGTRARRLYEKHFRAEAMAQNFVDLYQTVKP